MFSGGAPRIHGELLKLGFEVSQTTVATYMHSPIRTAVAGLAHVPAQPRAACRRNRPLRRPDHRLQATLRPRYPAARSPIPGVDGSNHEPERALDRSADQRGIPVGRGAPLPDPGQRWFIWRGLSAAAPNCRDSRPSDRTTITVTERTCGAADRVGPTGSCRPCPGAG